jgi:hypothetical protein
VFLLCVRVGTRMCAVDRVGSVNVPDLKTKGIDMTKIMHMHIQLMESLVATEEYVARERKVMRYKHIAIIDMQGLGFAHMGKEFYGPMKQIIDIDQYFYPDTLWRMFIVNAPFVFRALWAIVSPMLDPVTRTKINFGTDKLLEVIDKESLPKFLGGTCKVGPLCLPCDAMRTTSVSRSRSAASPLSRCRFSDRGLCPPYCAVLCPRIVSCAV